MRDFIGDPYKVAFLRGGDRHTLHVALLNLIEQDRLVEVVSSRKKELRVAITGRGSMIDPAHPLDRAIMRLAPASPTSETLLADGAVRQAMDAIDYALIGNGLATSSIAVATGRRLAYGAVAAIGSILFLFTLIPANPPWPSGIGLGICWFAGVVSIFAILRRPSRRRTARGATLLKLIDELCVALKARVARAVPHTQSQDVVLAAAVFGLGVLPAKSFPIAAIVVRRAKDNNGGDSGLQVGIEWGADCSAACCGGGGGGGDGGGCGGGCGG